VAVILRSHFRTTAKLVDLVQRARSNEALCMFFPQKGRTTYQHHDLLAHRLSHISSTTVLRIKENWQLFISTNQGYRMCSDYFVKTGFSHCVCSINSACASSHSCVPCRDLASATKVGRVFLQRETMDRDACWRPLPSP